MHLLSVYKIYVFTYLLFVLSMCRPQTGSINNLIIRYNLLESKYKCLVWKNSSFFIFYYCLSLFLTNPTMTRHVLFTISESIPSIPIFSNPESRYCLRYITSIPWFKSISESQTSRGGDLLPGHWSVLIAHDVSTRSSGWNCRCKLIN